ncbi:MAG: hypothetical protein LBC56_08335 [Oscillospiraceae bacterium]|nr:hypothetical protein [Oscillospiraceae bacterium]
MRHDSKMPWQAWVAVTLLVAIIGALGVIIASFISSGGIEKIHELRKNCPDKHHHCKKEKSEAAPAEEIAA